MNNIITNNLSVRKVVLLSVIFLLTGVISISCKKVESELGKGVQSDDDQLGVKKTDTFSLITYSSLQDTVRSDEKSNMLLGSYADPIFGNVSAGFATQLKLEGNNPDFGTFGFNGLEVDSVVLALDFSGYYGTLEAQNFKVYRLNTTVQVDSSFFTTSTPDFDPTDLVELGGNIITPNPFDSILVGTNMERPHLRIRLDKTLGEDFINATPAGDLVDDESFTTFFPGIYVTTDNVQSNGEGAIFSFARGDLDTKLIMYYHDDDNPAREFSFKTGTSTCGTFNKIDFDNTMTTVFAQYDADSTLGQNEFYAQSGLLKTRIMLPTLTDLSGQNIAINKADLELPVKYFAGDAYAPPSSMFIFGDKEGENEVITLDIAEYSSTNKNYSVDLTWHVQRVQTGEVTNKELILIPNGFYSGIERVILNGPNTSLKHSPKLIVTYTEY